MKKRLAKRFAALSFAVVLCAVSGCGSNTSQTEEQTEEASVETKNTYTGEQEASPEETEASSEEPDTGDAALDDPRNEDDIGEKEILVTSFGTSYNDSRRLTIGAIEQKIEEKEPDFSVRRAFTSQMIIDHIKTRDDVKIDNVEEALERAEENGVHSLVVAPTHLMDGFEYHDLIEEVAKHSDSFEAIGVAAPLLSDASDFTTVAEALIGATESYKDGKTAICFMGHGTEAASNGVYERMQQEMTSLGEEDIYIGTVEASPTLEDILSKIKEKDYKRVVLRPLMVVAGDHANNDMAGDEPDSWKSVFESEGYEVECVLEGIAQIEEIRELYAEHVKNAVSSLKDQGNSPAGNLSAVLEAARASEKAAEEAAMANAKTPEEAGLSDGEYLIGVELSGGSGRAGISSPAKLSVKDGSITATIEWSSANYDYMRIGEEKYLPVNTEGNSVFEIPVSVFDAPMAVVADTTAMSQPHEIDYELIFDLSSVSSNEENSKKND